MKLIQFGGISSLLDQHSTEMELMRMLRAKLGDLDLEDTYLTSIYSYKFLPYLDESSREL